MINPTRPMALRAALCLNGLGLGMWETARLLSQGENDEGTRKLARMALIVKSLTRQGEFAVLRAFNVEVWDASHYHAMLDMIQRDPTNALQTMSEIVEKHAVLFRPLFSISR